MVYEVPPSFQQQSFTMWSPGGRYFLGKLPHVTNGIYFVFGMHAHNSPEVSRQTLESSASAAQFQPLWAK